MAASAWTSVQTRSLDLLSDERLARLAARGDERAFGVLFGRHEPGLTRYCRTILRHQADAEDAAQNAMVAAVRALGAGTTPMRVKPWLYRIAHNEALGLVRLRRPAEELDEAVLPAVADAEEAGEVRRRLGQLLADLRALTDRQREALVLRELCGMGYAEIAQTLGSSEAAAQQTVFEARSALQSFGEGRALDCEGVQRALSDCDGMRLRTRTVRAHLRGCERCKDFESALLTRRRDLGLLFPPGGAAGGVLAALARIFGGGGGESLLAGVGIKGAAVGLAVLAGGGAVVATTLGGTDAPPAPVTARPAAAHAAAAAATAPAGPAAPAARATRGHAGRTHATRPGAKVRRPAHAPTGGTTVAAVSGPAAPGASGSGTTGTGGDGAASRDSAASGGGGTGTGTSASPTAKAPAPVQSVANTVTQVTDTATGAVQGAVGQVTDTANGAVDTVTDTAGQVTTTAQGAVGGAVDTVTNALPKLP